MRSHEVVRLAADRIGVKALAAKLRLSPALVYKWCQESSRDDPDSSGAINPLDRLSSIVSATGEAQVVNWLCHEAGGFFVANPRIAQEQVKRDFLLNTQSLVQEFSLLLTEVTRAIEDDGQIGCDEADRIRAAWQVLKSAAEGFVVACERGLFRKDVDGPARPAAAP